jgi:hypothetical protein
VGEVFVGVLGFETPTNRDWQRWMDLLEGALRENVTILRLIVTDGGGPTASQRAALERISSEAQTRAALITPSTLARGIFTAVSWFHPKNTMAAFRPGQLDEALRFLGVGAEKKAELDRIIAELRADLVS